jgi:adenylate cyclase
MLRRNELDYVVDGAITVANDRYHINVRLLDLTRYATPVWSDRFELGIDELHLIDEKLTARIVGQIDPIILYIEGQPRRREHYSANQLLLRAIQMMFTMERGPFEEAGLQIERALGIDPEDAMIAAWAAFWQVIYIGQGWNRDIPSGLRAAQTYALRAMKLDPENAEALGMYAHVCAFLDRDFDTAKLYFDRSLRLNPNLCYIWALSAMTYCYIGEPDEALARLARYRDLAPFDPYFALFETMYPIVLMFKGDYQEAAAVGHRVIRANPHFVNCYKAVIAALGHLDRIEEAKVYVETLLELEPDFTVRRFIESYPIKKESDRDRFAYGLRAADIPEG